MVNYLLNIGLAASIPVTYVLLMHPHLLIEEPLYVYKRRFDVFINNCEYKIINRHGLKFFKKKQEFFNILDKTKDLIENNKLKFTTDANKLIEFKKESVLLKKNLFHLNFLLKYKPYQYNYLYNYKIVNNKEIIIADSKESIEYALSITNYLIRINKENILNYSNEHPNILRDLQTESRLLNTQSIMLELDLSKFLYHK